MATFPINDVGQRTETAGANVAGGTGTSFTSNASANTKGSYAQLIAATAFDASMMMLMFSRADGGIDYLVDVAIGASGSEVIILSNVLVSGGTGQQYYGSQFFFPVNIPAGTRLAIRSQSTTGTIGLRADIMLFQGGFGTPETQGFVTTYGANTADSGGVQVDPGGTTNTKGSYSEITSSTTYPIRFLSIVIGNQLNTVRSTQLFLMDVAIGASGSEVIILPDLLINANVSPDVLCPQVYTNLPVQIPAGTRIAVRAASNGNDATDRLFDVVMYGAT